MLSDLNIRLLIVKAFALVLESISLNPLKLQVIISSNTYNSKFILEKVIVINYKLFIIVLKPQHTLLKDELKTYMG